MKIKKCPACARYTLKHRCPVCGIDTANARPARFSPEDPYGGYRRKMKKEMLQDADKKSSP